MVHIHELAPTIMEAVKAVETGCRKVQDDPHYRCDTLRDTAIFNSIFYGGVAAIALLQLTEKSASDIVKRVPTSKDLLYLTEKDKADAFGVGSITVFEDAMNSFGQNALNPLLKFYALDRHKNAATAAKWLGTFPATIVQSYFAEKENLIPYADHLKYRVLPKLQEWFAPATLFPGSV